MAKVMSKSKIVGHLADKLETPRKTVTSFFDELFKLAVKECKGGAGKFVSYAPLNGHSHPPFE